jgi:hypothetical protein
VNGDDDDQPTTAEVLTAFAQWQADIDSEPFKHEDFWTPTEQAAR